jgi:enterochelin esterase-like enzyme
VPDRRRARNAGRAALALALLAWAVVGGLGLAGYWSSYYVHRGFAPLRHVRHSGRGDNVVVHFYSQALHAEYDYRVFLPSGYDPRRYRYPVYYLLHGAPGRPQVYIAIADMGVRLDNLIALHKARPMILVFPDGRIGGSTYSDSEWADTPSGAYASDVVDVVRDVERRFSVLADRRDRAIAGFSMGGYGAANIALRHLALFAHLQVWSGYFRQTRSGVFAHASHALLAANSPLDYVHRLRSALRRDPLDAYMYVGRGDRDSRQIVPMYEAMRAAGAKVAYHVFAGGHDWQLWNAHANAMIVRASRDFGGPWLAPRHPRAHHVVRRRGSRQRSRRRVSRRPGVPARRHRSRHRGGILRLVTFRRPLRTMTRPRPLATGTLLGGLGLALTAAALINLGFLLQHRGLATGSSMRALAGLRAAFASRAWLAGQLIGWLGFAAQVAAVVIAPLSLVQAFAAGGLALSVPLAATVFGHRIGRRELRAVLLIAVALALLPVAASASHDRLGSDRLALSALVALACGGLISATRLASGRAIAAGIFYGVADAGIKAVAVGWHRDGAGSLLSGWTALAALGTLAGFLAFQAALREGSAVGSISLMTAFTTLVALACGLLSFGESLGRGGGIVALHTVAIAVVLLCVRPLAATQAQMAEAPPALVR